MYKLDELYSKNKYVCNKYWLKNWLKAFLCIYLVFTNDKTFIYSTFINTATVSLLFSRSLGTISNVCVWVLFFTQLKACLVSYVYRVFTI